MGCAIKEASVITIYTAAWTDTIALLYICHGLRIIVQMQRFLFFVCIFLFFSFYIYIYIY